MRVHTAATLEILKRVARFRQFAATAAAHHERLDGSYHLGMHGDQLGQMARILAVADVAAALAADRPHRPGISPTMSSPHCVPMWMHNCSARWRWTPWQGRSLVWRAQSRSKRSWRRKGRSEKREARQPGCCVTVIRRRG